MTASNSVSRPQNSKPFSVDCPSCGTRVVWNAESTSRPFCSERCRLIDLGEWASEGHRISGTNTYSDETGTYSDKTGED